MNDDPELLQQKLARLEAGEPLDELLAGLPESEASLLRLAAALRTLPGGLKPSGASAQRQALLRAATERNATPASPQPRTAARPRWLVPAVLAGGAAVFGLATLVLLAALAGLTWLRPAGPQPSPLAQSPDPRMATLNTAHGLVETQSAAGRWSVARAGDRVRAGQRVRTGSLSSVTLAFYDGSQARLGPNTEVSVDNLDAQTSGPRVVQLTQWLGDTEHHVAPSSDPASAYAVATPSGVGTAKGTVFHVLVTAALLARFDVDEGEVDVTSLDVTVVVIAGQSSTIVSGEPPQEPVFRISGEGQASEIGSTWRIAGRTFLTNSRTVVGGDPQPGDWVAFEGRILSDGTRFADRIVIVRRAALYPFHFSRFLL